MEKILNCIDEYIKDLEIEVMKILNNQKSSLTEKNALIEPLSEQKKILNITKETLINIQNRDYQGGCTMWKYQGESKGD